MEPFDVGDAGRMAVFSDPQDAAFCVWQPNGHRGAAVVNEHASLNFNALNTREPEGAKSFYGSVFGCATFTASKFAPENPDLAGGASAATDSRSRRVHLIATGRTSAPARRVLALRAPPSRSTRSITSSVLLVSHVYGRDQPIPAPVVYPPADARVRADWRAGAGDRTPAHA